MELSRSAVCTSGDAEQFLESGGVRHSHLIDPRTGLAVTGSYQFSVVASSGMEADALASAACVLGSRAGIEHVLESGGQARVSWLEEGHFRQAQSPGFAALQLAPGED